MEEEVLVFDQKILERLGYFHRFTTDLERYLPAILDPNNNCFVGRTRAETSHTLKQIIPYVVLRYKDSIYSYTRGKESLEKRLVGFRSIGLGGHIERRDREASSSDMELYRAAANREVKEEVSIASPYEERILALIYSDATEVDRVHFGILHAWDLAFPEVSRRESQITNDGFLGFSELGRIYSELETWSQIAIDILRHPDTPKYLLYKK